MWINWLFKRGRGSKQNSEINTVKERVDCAESVSPLWLLPRDILHCIYSEWLASWHDLSVLDVCCLRRGNRRPWLLSLNELRMTSGIGRRLSDKAMSTWYLWVGSRKVLLVEGFLVRLTLLETLVERLDYRSYCSALRSIEIERDLGNADLSALEIEAIEEKLGLFLNACNRVQGVRISGFVEEGDENLEAGLCSTLCNGLEDNSLLKIEFLMFFYPSFDPLTNLLSKHVSSLKELVVHASEEMSLPITDILVCLLENSLYLKRLSLSGEFLSIDVLFDYLSFSGMCLEKLEVGGNIISSSDVVITYEVFTFICKSCPGLKTLSLNLSNEFGVLQVRKPSELYQLCPNLVTLLGMSVSPFAFINVIERKRKVQFFSTTHLSLEEKEDWLECLCYVLERTHYTLTSSNLPFCKDLVVENDEWTVVKHKLSPFLVDIEGAMSEAILLDILKEFPRLEKLDVQAQEQTFSDDCLAGLIDYGCRLKKIYIRKLSLRCSFSDEMISKMIRSCNMLEVLMIPCAGSASILAVKSHLRLKEVYLYNTKIDLIAMKALLCGKERNEKSWLKLTKGEIVGHGFVFFYEEKSWVSRGRES
eukprot:scaffold3136_cov239-Ochromonas_danica.AAC.2